jgi:hypothetical protein
MQDREKLGQTEVLEVAGKKKGLATNVPEPSLAIPAFFLRSWPRSGTTAAARVNKANVKGSTANVEARQFAKS